MNDVDAEKGKGNVTDHKYRVKNPKFKRAKTNHDRTRDRMPQDRCSN
jgi:hypothetical protein